MSKIIEGIPESFTRDQYIALFEAVGLNPYDIMSLEFRAEGVYAVVFDLDDEGKRRYVDEFGERRAVKHRIFIPVDGGLPDREAFHSVATLRGEAVSA